MYDVIIVGARCAGSPTAALLARKGHKVLLVDRARFPSDTMSTHFIHHPGVAHLARWGVLDKVMATNVPPITTTAFGAVGEPPADIPPLPGIPGAIAPRRTVLDMILVDEAVAAGAELRENFTFEDVVRDDDRVVGIRGRSSDGHTVRENARLVVGADGRHSTVATAVGADMYKHVASLGCGYYSYWSDFANKGVEIHFLDTNVFILFPTNDGLTVVIALWPVDRFPEVRRDVEGSYLKAFRDFPEVGERLDAARREERFVGSADIPNLMRTAAGPGWALVGDAAYHKDPTPADGITDAFSGVELLVESADRYLTNPDDSNPLGDYARRLHETSIEGFELCLEISSFETDADTRALKFADHVVQRFMEAGEVLSQTESMATS